MNEVVKWVGLLANIFTIAASAIVIGVFVAKRESISSVFDLLINYTFNLSLSEIKEKLERLNEYNANESEQLEHIINILNEIIGQIKGNDKLNAHFSKLLLSLEDLVGIKGRLTEPRKRALVSELRERIRHLNVANIDNLIGERDE